MKIFLVILGSLFGFVISSNLISPMYAQVEQPLASVSTQNMSSNATQGSVPDVILMKVKGDLGLDSSSTLIYDSLSGESISVTGWSGPGPEGTALMRHMNDFDESAAMRLLKESGFFEANSYYPPAPNSTDYREYNIIASSSNGNLHSVYWSDTSNGVPEEIQNLPFALGYVLGTGRIP